MSNNKLIIAAAGSGKTTYLVQEALKSVNQNVLITTFTEANEAEIIKKIYDINKFIPKNIKVQTWYSVLLQHGVKPYQGYMFEGEINGINLIGGRSSLSVSENNIKAFYLDEQNKIYNDKISKFIINCNKKSDGKVIKRLSDIYSYIYFDEAQDFAGYDLELINLLLRSNINNLLVCDPRQATYSTNQSAKNSQYAKSKIVRFFKTSDIEIDEDTFSKNYRSIPEICELSDKLYPKYHKTTSGNTDITLHNGLFLVKLKDVNHYLSQYKPMQLRENRKRKITNDYPVMNFGASKGLTFDRVLIYPTKPIYDWLKNNEVDLAPISRAKLYVAITRAKYSVAFVDDSKNGQTIQGVANYIMD